MLKDNEIDVEHYLINNLNYLIPDDIANTIVNVFVIDIVLSPKKNAILLLKPSYIPDIWVPPYPPTQ